MTEGSFPKAIGDTWHASEGNNALGIVDTLAGENITTGNVVYIHLSDGKAYISDTGATNDIRATGMALNTATTGNTVYVQSAGIFTTSSLTAQQIYYLGASGALSTTKSGVRIGTAVSTTKIHINIVQDDRDMVGTIKPYAKSFTAIPSNNVTAFWKECDGSVLSDVESPLNGQTLPNLNGSTDATKKFLRGSTTSGTVGSDTTHAHSIGQSVSTIYNPMSDANLTYDSASGTGAAGNVPPYYEVVMLIKVK
jgi:hypothetical protein